MIEPRRAPPFLRGASAPLAASAADKALAA